MPENPDAVALTHSAFKSLLGMEPTKNADPTKQPDDVSYLNRFSNSESQALAKTTYIAPIVKNTDFSASGIISYLKPIHQKVGENILDARKMGALAPEIEQSKILVSSSIMSPNDLQDGFFSFNFDRVPALANDPELLDKVQELYHQHFNGNLELGIKSYDWIGECQYETGSKAILILPVASLLEYKHRTEEDVKKTRDKLLKPGMSSFDEYTKEIEKKDGSFLYTDSFKFKFTESTLDTLKNVAPALESYQIALPDALRTTNYRRTGDEGDIDSNFIKGLESVVVNLKKTIEEGDVIHITENPEIVKFNVDKKLFDKKHYQESLKKYFKDKFKENYPVEEVGFLEASPSKFPHVAHPVLIELPSEAVIPLHIPGAPNQHLGYFILLDEHGQPLTIENSGLARNQNSTQCGEGSPNAAYTALYGSGCSSTYFSKKPDAMSNIGTTVFNYLLDQYFRARMVKLLGRADLSLERFNAVSTIMFQRLLEQKKTTVLYVPPALLHYFAFAYAKDGTGMSKLEDIKFLLSLRTTLLMAQIIAMVNDAIDHKKIELTVDDKTSNLEALMELVGNIFIEKNRLSGNIDPSEIVRDIYSNSLTIVPKNIPGLGNFEVDVSTINSQSTRPDDALLEQLNNLLISKLDVPPAALNQMNEPEFARSVVTYNLFFAKKVTRYQRIWCKQIEEFIRDYAYFDITFQKALKQILEAHSKHAIKENFPDKVKKLKAKNPNKRSQISNAQLIQTIIENVTVSLPKPDIVVDKTQFEEIRNYSGNVNEMADMIYPNELVPTSNQEAQDGLNFMKSMWKREQMLKFISDIGCFKMFDVKEADDFNSDDLVNFIQVCMNLGMHVKKHGEAMTSGDDGGMGGSGYGGGDDYGGGGDDFGGGDEGGEDEGMGDMGDMDMGMEEEAPESQETGPEVEPTEAEEEEGGGEATATMYFNIHKKRFLK